MKKSLHISAILLLGIMLSCDDDIYIPETEWFYFDIVSADTFHFSRIYVPDGPEIYQDITYGYPHYPTKDDQYGHSAFKLPLSPFSDSVTYIFEQPGRKDTLKVNYTQGVEFVNRRDGLVYLFQEPEISYSTFDSLLVCIQCYRIR